MGHPIVRRSLEVEGRRVSYLTVDDVRATETLLLIHGAGVSARTWVNQLGGLADSLRPIAIDLPGRHESDPDPDPSLEAYAETAYQALARLRTGPVFVAGHSLGGAVAQVLAARHPEVVKGLVLISTCARMPPADALTRLLASVPSPLRRPLVQWTARRTLFGPSAPWNAIGLTLNELRDCPLATIQSDTAMGRAIDLESLTPALRVPTLILCGDADRLTTPALSRQLGDMIPGSRVEIVRSAGHMLPLEAPASVNQAIADFVRAVTCLPSVSRVLPAPSTRSGLRAGLERAWRALRARLDRWAPAWAPRRPSSSRPAAPAPR